MSLAYNRCDFGCTYLLGTVMILSLVKHRASTVRNNSRLISANVMEEYCFVYRHHKQRPSGWTVLETAAIGVPMRSLAYSLIPYHTGKISIVAPPDEVFWPL